MSSLYFSFWFCILILLAFFSTLTFALKDVIVVVVVLLRIHLLAALKETFALFSALVVNPTLVLGNTKVPDISKQKTLQIMFLHLGPVHWKPNLNSRSQISVHLQSILHLCSPALLCRIQRILSACCFQSFPHHIQLALQLFFMYCSNSPAKPGPSKRSIRSRNSSTLEFWEGLWEVFCIKL